MRSKAMLEHNLERLPTKEYTCTICGWTWKAKPTNECPGVKRYAWGKWGNLMTKRQLDEAGYQTGKKLPLPTGCYWRQAEASWLWLYDKSQSVPKNAPTKAQERALSKAKAARGDTSQLEAKARELWPESWLKVKITYKPRSWWHYYEDSWGEEKRSKCEAGYYFDYTDTRTDPNPDNLDPEEAYQLLTAPGLWLGSNRTEALENLEKEHAEYRARLAREQAAYDALSPFQRIEYDVDRGICPICKHRIIGKFQDGLYIAAMPCKHRLFHGILAKSR